MLRMLSGKTHLGNSGNLHSARACSAARNYCKGCRSGAGLFETKTIGNDNFTFTTKCKDPKAYTIMLRGAIIDETERNLQHALHAARNFIIEPHLVPGGGAKWHCNNFCVAAAAAEALNIIPRTLTQNCGANTIRTLTALEVPLPLGRA
ncbi:T-complex protein 1 subunit gamma-like [Musca autumnalis]|uniref:T-complex protein 1 subunit gamma-like n=1 Tax=Musca autumnalis TaxID=221902 RepID=UPI003CF8F290